LVIGGGGFQITLGTQSLKTLTIIQDPQQSNELWIYPDTKPPGLYPWLSMALVVGPFEKEEEGIGVTSDVVKSV